MTKKKILFEDLQGFKDMKEYRESSEIHYSMLKELEYNPNILIEPFTKKQTPAMILGSMVDTILTEPTEFNKRFYVGDIELPSEAIQEMIDTLFNCYKIFGDLDSKENAKYILEVVEDFGYGNKNWHEETKLKKIIEGGDKYYKELQKCEGRTIVSTSTYLTANNVAHLLTTHPWTAHYFSNKDPDIEVIFQFKFRFNLEGVSCKAALDILVVDHKQQRIMPIDIKVGEQSFMKSYHQFKWYLQGALYKEGIENFIEKMDDFSGYVVENFKFIHVYVNNLNYPTIYEMPERLHEMAMLGWKDTNNKNILGIYELIEDVIWYENYRKEPGVEYLVPRKLIEQKGILFILPPATNNPPF